MHPQIFLPTSAEAAAAISGLERSLHEWESATDPEEEMRLVSSDGFKHFGKMRVVYADNLHGDGNDLPVHTLQKDTLFSLGLTLMLGSEQECFGNTTYLSVDTVQYNIKTNQAPVLVKESGVDPFQQPYGAYSIRMVSTTSVSISGRTSVLRNTPSCAWARFWRLRVRLLRVGTDEEICQIFSPTFHVYSKVSRNKMRAAVIKNATILANGHTFDKARLGSIVNAPSRPRKRVRSSVEELETESSPLQIQLAALLSFMNNKDLPKSPEDSLLMLKGVFTGDTPDEVDFFKVDNAVDKIKNPQVLPWLGAFADALAIAVESRTPSSSLEISPFK